eukprot:TRINITY_DN39047_c0_g1_i2.p1 TRINITY_DN39047_c0_g1~~TRINITY_DN39047_c0_g1_i2.p1  ORF type:complete len:196 (-),score=44.62 TRINITY_DN39047_c0_g1_i2:81-668(-)
MALHHLNQMLRHAAIDMSDDATFMFPAFLKPAWEEDPVSTAAGFVLLILVIMLYCALLSTFMGALLNVTTHERLNVSKLQYLYTRSGEYLNPFDEGKLMNLLSFCQVTPQNSGYAFWSSVGIEEESDEEELDLQPCPLAARDDPAPAPAEELDELVSSEFFQVCLLYTSDAADEEDSVDLGGRRIIKKKNKRKMR